MISLDSCIVIDAVESGGDLGDRVRAAISERPDETFAISPLVMLETLVAPLRAHSADLLDAYRSIFGRFEVLDLSTATYLDAAELRAQHPRLRTVDALHLAAARRGGCAAFWTNDRRLSAVAPSFAIDIVS